MEPTNKSLVSFWRKSKPISEQAAIDFLPDADEMERTPLPSYARLTIHILGLGLLAFVIWASLSKVEKIVIAHGRMVNPAPNVILQPLETGVIKAILVRPGQIVKKGDVLATLDPTFSQADEAQLMGRMKTLELQARGLRAELDGKTSIVTTEGAPPPAVLLPSSGSGSGINQNEAAQAARNDTDSQIQANLARERLANYRAQQNKNAETFARVQASLVTNQRDQQALAARLRAVREIEMMQEKLVANQFGARLRLLEAQDKRLEIERDLLSASNREMEIKSELAVIQAEGEAFEKGRRQKISEDLLATIRELSSVNEQLAKANLRHKLVAITSPIEAVVLDVAKLSVGSVVREAETFFTLVPIGAELEAEVQIDSLDVGYIKSGDDVHLKLDAFPFQQHGVLEAKVRSISEDAFRRETAAPGGLDAYYISRLKIGTVKLKGMANRSRLLPGMTLNAEIVVGKRTVMSYLLWPLNKALDEAIREP